MDPIHYLRKGKEKIKSIYHFLMKKPRQMPYEGQEEEAHCYIDDQEVKIEECTMDFTTDSNQSMVNAELSEKETKSLTKDSLEMESKNLESDHINEEEEEIVKEETEDSLEMESKNLESDHINEEEEIVKEETDLSIQVPSGSILIQIIVNEGEIVEKTYLTPEQETLSIKS